MNRIKESLNAHICDKDTLKRKIDSKIQKPHKTNVLVMTFASLIFIFLLSGYIYLEKKEVSYVSIDINPSIVLSANRFDRVIKVEGLNSDAKKVLQNIDVKNEKLNVAVNKIVDEATRHGFLDPKVEDNAVLVTTYCNDIQKREELQNDIHNSLRNNLMNRGIKSLIIDQELTEEDIKMANEYHVSQGKILFVKKAIEEHPELKLEDLIYLPIKEIAKYIEGYEEINFDHGGNGNANGQKNCNGYGKCGNK